MQRGISYPTGNCFVKVKRQFPKLKKDTLNPHAIFTTKQKKPNIKRTTLNAFILLNVN